MDEMKVFKDGDSWCFVLPDFIDLQNSPSYWPENNEINLDEIYKKLQEKG
jgi:hypothetical protein